MNTKNLSLFVAVLVALFGFAAFAQAATILFPTGGGTGWGELKAHTVLIGNGTAQIATATPSVAGYVLTSNGVNADPTFQPATGAITSVSSVYPVLSSGGATPAISLAFGTTTSNLWAGTQTFTNPIDAGPLTGLIAGNVGTTYAAATSSVTINGPLTTSGTPGALVGGTSLTIGCQTASGSQAGCLSSADWTTFNGKGNGTVTAVSVASTNGFAGSSSGGATPALTISTSITGVLKGNGTAISAAANGTDFSLITAKTCTAGDFVSAVTAAGAFTCSTPVGTSFGWPFTPTSNFGVNTSATSTPLWAQSGLYASSTSQFDNSSTTMATIGNVFINGSTIKLGGTLVDLLLQSSSGQYDLYNGVNYAKLNTNSLSSSDKTFTFPNASGTFCLTTTCLTANQSITLSGVITGTGSTAITTSFGSASNGVLANPAAGSAVPSFVATSTLNIALSDTTGTLAVGRGGTGVGTFTSSQLLYGNGTNALSSVATTSVTLGLGLSGSIIGVGGAQTLTIATSSLYTGSTGQIPSFTGTNTLSGNSLLTFGNGGGTPTLTIGASSNQGSLVLTGATSGSTQLNVAAAATGHITLPNLTGVAALGSYLTGYTLGSIPFGSSGLLATSSNLIFDNTNSRLGVASSTPWALLSINPIAGVNNELFAIGSSTRALFGINAWGQIQLSATQPATTTAIVLDWSATGQQVEYQIGTSATTITFVNATTSTFWGSTKRVWVCDPGAAAGTLTWLGVDWIGTAPTQTTTANQCDLYSFDITRATSTSAYKVAGAASTGLQ